MTDFTLECDGTGREVIRSAHGADGRPEFLVLCDVVFDLEHGHAHVVDPQKAALSRLSPMQAKMLTWLEAKRGHAKPNIFAGEPVG